MRIKNMRLGIYNIPENRFIPVCVSLIKKICLSAKDIHNLSSEELAAIMNIPNPTGGAYYRKMASLTYYGLLEYTKKRYSVTELGENVAFVDDENLKNETYRKAILNIELWKELWNRFPNGIEDNFPYILKNITSVDLTIIKKHEKDIRKWYEQDISIIQNKDYTDKKSKDYSSEIHNTDMQHSKYELSSNLNHTTQAIKENPIEDDSGNLTMKIKGISTPFNIPFNDEKTLQVAINVLNIFADKFGINVTIQRKPNSKTNNDLSPES